ncbi:GerAB/ArcD/ProY family transporter [Salsuginibacillus halophilus]|nr:GerAB/ArcD/ProY family transporter [Salsuginibacillus halophilus]
MSSQPPKYVQTPPFSAFFLVHAMQIGVGVLGFQRVVMEASGYDAWMSVLFAGVGVSVSIWLMYIILNTYEADIVTIHKLLFGSLIGNALSLILMIYFFVVAVVILRTFIEVLQVWVFYDLQTWVLSVLAAVFFWFALNGGFRLVAGLCVFGVLFPSGLFIILYLPLEYAEINNILPILQHNFQEVALGAKETILAYIGPELLLMAYPFIERARLSHKWAQMGHAATVYIYFSVMVVSLLFYSEMQIERLIWPTLTMLKIVEFPFIERFEYVGLFLWLIVVTPNIALCLWASSRGVKRIFSIRQRTALYVMLPIFATLPTFFADRQGIETFNNAVSTFGLYILIGYLPFLFIIHQLKRWLKGGRRNETN